MGEGEARKDRLKAALRENLKRRKVQARGRETLGAQGDAKADTNAPADAAPERPDPDPDTIEPSMRDGFAARRGQ